MSPTIADVIKNINRQYFLPAIQREFVWSTDKIELLFDSILQGFPIGIFLFWELKREDSSSFPEIYEFVDRYDERGTHNQQAQTNGEFDITLVLDGQQRMTALFLGLKGSYTEKIKGKRKNNPNAYIEKKLFLNLLPDRKSDELISDENKPKYHFEFKSPQDVQVEILTSKGECWFEVGKILNFPNKDEFLNFKCEITRNLENRDDLRNLQKTLDTLYSSIRESKENIREFTSTDADEDKILEIFVRANSGGVKLSKSDLLLSMLTHHWSSATREKVYKFQDRLNKSLSRKNNFNKDFILKTALMLIDADIAYKIKNFRNQEHLQQIEYQWPRITQTIEATVNLINSMGLDESTLTSHNALIPIIYYAYKNGIESFEGTCKDRTSDRKAIFQWLLSILLNRTFSGQSDNVLRHCREALNAEIGPGFPAEGLNRAIRKLNKTASLEVEFIDSLLEKGYGDPDTFFILSLLYERTDWGTTDYHIDHIFPKTEFTDKKLKKHSIPENKIQQYIEKKDSLANLQLLTSRENHEKSAKPFDAWVKEQSPDYKTLNSIPQDESLFAWQAFDSFLEARETLIRARLAKLFEKPDSIREEERKYAALVPL